MWEKRARNRWEKEVRKDRKKGREGARSQTSSRPECPRTWPVLSQAVFQFTQSNWLSAPLSCLHLLAAAGVIGCLLTPRIEFLWLHVHWKSRQELFSDEKSSLRFSPQTPSETHSSTHARSQPSAWPGCYLLSCCTSGGCDETPMFTHRCHPLFVDRISTKVCSLGLEHQPNLPEKNHLFLFSTKTELFSWFFVLEERVSIKGENFLRQFLIEQNF